MRKIIFPILVLLLLAACNENNRHIEKIRDTIHSVYSVQESIYDRKIDSNLFSQDLQQKINRVIAVTRLDEEKIANSEYPTDKPLLLEGSVFSGLYDGYTTYHIGEIKIRDQRAEAAIDFEYESKPTEAWSDKVILINENGWKIDNVIFSSKYSPYKDLNHKLAFVLEEYKQ